MMDYRTLAKDFNLNPQIKTKYEPSWLVYFLLKDSIIVYVGKSSEKSLRGRLQSHKEDKDFDSYFTISPDLNEQDTLALESAFIQHIGPQFNKAGNMEGINTHQRINAIMHKGVYVNGNNLLIWLKLSIPRLASMVATLFIVYGLLSWYFPVTIDPEQLHLVWFGLVAFLFAFVVTTRTLKNKPILQQRTYIKN